MDFNQILAIINNARSTSEAASSMVNTNTSVPVPTETTPTSSTTASAPFIIPPTLDISKINPQLIQEVRAEYLASQQKTTAIPVTDEKQSAEPSLDQLLDSLQTVKTVTPELLMALGRMTQETKLIQVLRDCKRRQDAKERDLFNRREEILKKHQKHRDAIFAKELIGAVTPNEIQRFEDGVNEELKHMDIHILQELDKEARRQQQALEMLKVPCFKVTSDASDLKMQSKVLSILQDMINE
ncbi:uncharacterized protein BYT42DRAFT_611462 [Radiomyces spectabilis]|uniref:uncharacterized protein n=1 Tax=Radiomyces spectabilis TaxID=64574 RepID=UPI00222011F0|nr:uncharacterized protein BYT42DRAFT_611462 [Radiomyces spectabilis]KAI8388412.1 hypothetical protein BYT42DRAFT_611462 [Radiomyces spectabilis]